MLCAMAATATTVAQDRRAGDRPRTGTAQPRSGTGEQEKATPREPDGGQRAPREAPRVQRREDDRPAPPTVRRPDPGHVVFVGGYFYDPYFGPSPWWRPDLYPHIPIPAFEPLARIRITGAPRHAAVYVDGFYAGVVDDFDGYFQGLPLLPGGHVITLYLPGYQTITRRIFLTPRSVWKLREPMMPLPRGAVSEPPMVAALPPPPPQGTYLRWPTPPSGQPIAATAASVPLATLSLRVQPASARVTIDGQMWETTEPGTLVVQLPPGRHRVQVETLDGRAFTTDVDVAAAGVTERNISVPNAAP